jgi:midasin
MDLDGSSLSFGSFQIPIVHSKEQIYSAFSLDAPTTRRNLFRVIRALNSSKPIMLEGSPGSGKSSLITTLAALTGHKLFRLNLSEQTVNYFFYFTI